MKERLRRDYKGGFILQTLFHPFQYDDVDREVIIRFLLEIRLNGGIERKYWSSPYIKKNLERYAGAINSQTIKTG